MANEHLKQWREQHDPPLKQAEAAALVPVSKPTWSRWESGARRTDKSLLPRLKEITGLPAHVLRPDLAELMNDEAAA